MSQMDEEKVATGTTSDNKKNVRFVDDNSDIKSNGDSVVVCQSIGHGQIIFSSNDNQQQSSGDVTVNSFIDIEQSSAEQNTTTTLLDRIESPEKATQIEEDTWEENGSTTHNSTIVGIDDNKEGDNSFNSQRRRRSSIRRRKEKPWKYQRYPFPESTYTLLITENILSMPTVVGVITVAISLMALGITLKNELDNAEDGNPYGMPPGVVTEVRIAQFLGIIIGEYDIISSHVDVYVRCFECRVHRSSLP